MLSLVGIKGFRITPMADPTIQKGIIIRTTSQSIKVAHGLSGCLTLKLINTLAILEMQIENELMAIDEY